MRGILRYKKFERNDKNKHVQFLAALYNNIDMSYFFLFRITKLIIFLAQIQSHVNLQKKRYA
jgi:hypothetical protein